MAGDSDLALYLRRLRFNAHYAPELAPDGMVAIEDVHDAPELESRWRYLIDNHIPASHKRRVVRTYIKRLLGKKVDSRLEAVTGDAKYAMVTPDAIRLARLIRFLHAIHCEQLAEHLEKHVNTGDWSVQNKPPVSSALPVSDENLLSSLELQIPVRVPALTGPTVVIDITSESQDEPAESQREPEHVAPPAPEPLSMPSTIAASESHASLILDENPPDQNSFTLAQESLPDALSTHSEPSTQEPDGTVEPAVAPLVPDTDTVPIPLPERATSMQHEIPVLRIDTAPASPEQYRQSSQLSDRGTPELLREPLKRETQGMQSTTAMSSPVMVDEHTEVLSPLSYMEQQNSPLVDAEDVRPFESDPMDDGDDPLLQNHSGGERTVALVRSMHNAPLEQIKPMYYAKFGMHTPANKLPYVLFGWDDTIDTNLTGVITSNLDYTRINPISTVLAKIALGYIRIFDTPPVQTANPLALKYKVIIPKNDKRAAFNRLRLFTFTYITPRLMNGVTTFEVPVTASELDRAIPAMLDMVCRRAVFLEDSNHMVASGDILLHYLAHRLRSLPFSPGERDWVFLGPEYNTERYEDLSEYKYVFVAFLHADQKTWDLLMHYKKNGVPHIRTHGLFLPRADSPIYSLLKIGADTVHEPLPQLPLNQSNAARIETPSWVVCLFSVLYSTVWKSSNGNKATYCDPKDSFDDVVGVMFTQRLFTEFLNPKSRFNGFHLTRKQPLQPEMLEQVSDRYPRTSETVKTAIFIQPYADSAIKINHAHLKNITEKETSASLKMKENALFEVPHPHSNEVSSFICKANLYTYKNWGGRLMELLRHHSTDIDNRYSDVAVFVVTAYTQTYRIIAPLLHEIMLLVALFVPRLQGTMNHARLTEFFHEHAYLKYDKVEVTGEKKKSVIVKKRPKLSEQQVEPDEDPAIWTFNAVDNEMRLLLLFLQDIASTHISPRDLTREEEKVPTTFAKNSYNLEQFYAAHDEYRPPTPKKIYIDEPEDPLPDLSAVGVAVDMNFGEEYLSDSETRQPMFIGTLENPPDEFGSEPDQF